MKRLLNYLSNFELYPDQIILKKVKHGIYYQGKVTAVPDIYKNFYVLDHSRLTSRRKVEFTILEDI